MRRTWSSTVAVLAWLVVSDACTAGEEYALGNGISRSRPPLSAFVVSNVCGARIQSDITMSFKPHSALAIWLSRRVFGDADLAVGGGCGGKYEATLCSFSRRPPP